MTSLTLEQQKRRYSRELADYTLRQWNDAKRSQIEAERMSQGGINARKRSLGTSSVERKPDSSGDEIAAGVSNVHPSRRTNEGLVGSRLRNLVSPKGKGWF
ncbi:hypothetical protein BDZ89DRAFT_1110704 [Hymenopellis radicata]|nr:hypothetical protein BDZ89DRAFT_1110704 [Hymenopellis radicata]